MDIRHTFPRERTELKMDPVSRVDVYVSGENGYHTYRIPSLLRTKNGQLLAFCEGRRNSRADDGDIDLLLKRSADGGATWSPQQVVYGEDGDITIGNPCPVVDRETGRICMLFCRNNDDVLVTFSDDEGLTWAEPVDITSQVKPDDWKWYATGPGVGIQLASGRLLIPCDHNRKDGVRGSHTIYSDDGGKTWSVSESIEPGPDECQVVELRDGRVMLNARMQTEPRGFRAVTVSDDGGETWADFRIDKQLPEPTCQASFVAVVGKDPDGPVELFFCNPATQDSRTTLTVKRSSDEGETWSSGRVIQSGHAAYSCLSIIGNGELACLYETGDENAYEKIEICRFPIEWLAEGEA